MVFADSCRSWYKGGRADGKVIGIWPGSSLHYYEVLAEPRYEDFDYTYSDRNEDGEAGEGMYDQYGNELKEAAGKGVYWPEWRYLGNGFTQREISERNNPGTEDLAWYLERPVGEAILVAPES